MKLGLLNLSNKVKANRTISSTETLSIKSVLEALGHEVELINGDINKYDKLIVINGAINFFGGAINEQLINNYLEMAKFEGEILYFLVDLQLPFRQLWPSIKNRTWNEWTEKMVNVKNIKIISQSWNTDLVSKLHDNMYEVEHFPIDRWGIYFNELYDIKFADEKTHDLVYCGSNRSGKRIKKIQEFYINSELNTLLVGNMKEKHFKNVGNNIEFRNKVPTKDMIYTNSLGDATIIIGDNNYNGNMITLRVWESLLSNVVVFVDEEFDPEHKIFVDDIYYINSPKQVKERLPECIGRQQEIKDIGYINNPKGKDDWLNDLSLIVYNSNDLSLIV